MADKPENKEEELVSSPNKPAEDVVSEDISDVQFPNEQRQENNEKQENETMSSCNLLGMHVISVYKPTDDSPDAIEEEIMDTGISKEDSDNVPGVNENQIESCGAQDEENISSCSLLVEDIGLTAEEELETQRLIELAEMGEISENKQEFGNLKIFSERDNTLNSTHYEESKVKTLLASYRDRLLKKTRAAMNEQNNYNKETIHFGDEKIYSVNQKGDLTTNKVERKESKQIKWEVNEEDFSFESNLVDSDGSLTVNNEYFKKETRRKPYRHRYSFDDSRTYFRLPMNDTSGDYFIDRKLVPISIYQEGLMKKKWNPTQVVFEICSQCYWPPPEFSEISYSNAEGFLCGVYVKGQHFVPKEKGKTKKLARLLASSQFLRFLGFRFQYENRKGTVIDVFHDNSHKSNVDVSDTETSCTVEVSDLRQTIRRHGSQLIQEKDDENNSQHSKMQEKSSNCDIKSNEKVLARKRHYTPGMNLHEETPGMWNASNYRRPRLRMDDEKYVYNSSRHRTSSRKRRCTSGIIVSHCSSTTTHNTSHLPNYEVHQTFRNRTSLDENICDLREEDCLPISTKSLQRCLFNKNGSLKLSPDTSRAWLEAFKATRHT